MKKILLIESSPRPGFCKKVAENVFNNLKDSTDCEIIALRNYKIEQCRGCTLCFVEGSKKCPLINDDVKKICEKLILADGVIFIVPNYALNVPGILKNLFDRLAYLFHRPRLFNKVCLPIVVQGVYGGGKVSKYINDVMEFWGYKCIKGAAVNSGVSVDKNEISKKHFELIKIKTEKFKKEVDIDKLRQPSLFRVMLFRMTRTSMKYDENSLPADKEYYRKMGWFESQYYYEVKLSIFNKIAGSFFDSIGRKMAAKQK